MPPRFRSPPPDSAQDRPGDHLLSRTPGARLSVLPAVERVPTPHIPTPRDPWVSDLRDLAAKLATVPALVSLPPEPPVRAAAVAPCPTTRGVHRPRNTPRTWAAVAFLAALLALALILGAAR